MSPPPPLTEFVPLQVMQGVMSVLCGVLVCVMFQYVREHFTPRQPSRKPGKVTKPPAGAATPGQQAPSQPKKTRPQEAPRPRRKGPRPQQPHDEEHPAVQQDASPEVQPRLVFQKSHEESVKGCGTSETAETAETEADTVTLEEAGTPRHDGADSELADAEQELSGEGLWMTWESLLEATGASKIQRPQMEPAGDDPSNSPCQYIPVLVKVDPSAEDLDPSMYVKVRAHPEMNAFTPRHLLQEGAQGNCSAEFFP